VHRFKLNTFFRRYYYSSSLLRFLHCFDFFTRIVLFIPSDSKNLGDEPADVSCGAFLQSKCVMMTLLSLATWTSVTQTCVPSSIPMATPLSQK
jgi:hypothetical protein